jgi:hypothetical protein
MKRHYIVPIGCQDVLNLPCIDVEARDNVWAIISVDEHGASIVDSNYLSLEDARKAWPDAISPQPAMHLTPAQAEASAILGKRQTRKLKKR